VFGPAPGQQTFQSLQLVKTNHIEGTRLKVDSRFGFLSASCAVVPKFKLGNLLPDLFSKVSKLSTPYLESLGTNQRVVLSIQKPNHPLVACNVSSALATMDIIFHGGMGDTSRKSS
jgi:hypothetical protein